MQNGKTVTNSGCVREKNLCENVILIYVAQKFQIRSKKLKIWELGSIYICNAVSVNSERKLQSVAD